jgi:hypothetical protein
LIGGWAHSRDLTYVSSLFKAYNTEAKIFETLELAEQCGINISTWDDTAFSTSRSPNCRRFPPRKPGGTSRKSSRSCRSNEAPNGRTLLAAAVMGNPLDLGLQVVSTHTRADALWT